MLEISLEEWVEFIKAKHANKAEFLKNSKNSKDCYCKRNRKGSLRSESEKKTHLNAKLRNTYFLVNKL